eukprot:gene54231-42634_t
MAAAYAAPGGTLSPYCGSDDDRGLPLSLVPTPPPASRRRQLRGRGGERAQRRRGVGCERAIVFTAPRLPGSPPSAQSQAAAGPRRVGTWGGGDSADVFDLVAAYSKGPDAIAACVRSVWADGCDRALGRHRQGGGRDRMPELAAGDALKSWVDTGHDILGALSESFEIVIASKEMEGAIAGLTLRFQAAFLQAHAAEFADAVLAGDAAAAAALAAAAEAGGGGTRGGPLDSLLDALAAAPHATARHRAVRAWLGDHRDDAVAQWGQGIAAPTAPPCAVVFDFDHVLAVTELGATDVAHDLVAGGFGGATRVAQLRTMLASLAAGGAALAVVSRNSRDVVRRALGPPPGVGLAGFFRPHLVLGWEDYDGAKSAAIRYKVLAPLGLRADACLFVDDDAANVADARSGLPGAKVVHVAGGGGITAAQMAEVAHIASRNERWRPRLCGLGNVTLSTCGSTGDIKDTRIRAPCANDDFMGRVGGQRFGTATLSITPCAPFVTTEPSPAPTVMGYTSPPTSPPAASP